MLLKTIIYILDIKGIWLSYKYIRPLFEKKDQSDMEEPIPKN